MSRKNRRSRRRPVLVLVTLLLAVGAFVLWTRSGDTAPAAAGTPTAAPTSESAPSEAVPSGSGPSEDAEETVGEEAGEEAAETSSEPAPTASPEEDEVAGGLAPVAVSLSYTGYDAAAAAVVAGGYAAGVVEGTPPAPSCSAARVWSCGASRSARRTRPRPTAARCGSAGTR
jgi:cytoskeletal protein RodZ